MPAFAKLGQHVAPRDLSLIFSHLGLHGCLSWFGFFIPTSWAFIGGGFEADTAALEEEVQDFDLVVFPGPMCRRHSFLVLHLKVGTLVDEEFAHFVAPVLDGIVKRPLVLRIDNVKVGTQFY